ncbi:MAG: DNA polymerase III subunit gamma/tau [Proteobacteria bacterium]|jgi:DNA polymerase-3 subunit gamma/tau|nr:DNA polymerase III subunit gamma/tau [Pseudomonadota bacterium]
MSYQVLARKWRPRSFGELVGQAHVVAALSNALARGQLHHAWLLTGTRGVGKTTLARILAKSLNCETGVTATPCGVCGACTAIDAGRFVDLLELDAASNTGVDNMRDILDSARYAPTVGRYKVYLIDEVHMLSKGAFNSMLKTLEEPPEHVKFVLATTDPQKIPVTVLSRCLQLNLKPLPAAAIEARLAHIVAAESIVHDVPALARIARAAQGSLRDALSLLDQAIAHGGGEVREADVRAMLGVVERDHVYRIADALVAHDGAALLAEADAITSSGGGCGSALDELAAFYHRLAVAQLVPQGVDGDEGPRLAGYAAKLAPEEVQLAYQICVQGRADLALAPDEATGFAMTLLRLLAFEPAAASGEDMPEGELAAPSPRSARAPRVPRVAASRTDASTAAADQALTTPSVMDPTPEPAPEPTPVARRALRELPEDPAQWPAFVGGLGLTGMARQLAAQSELKSIRGNALALAVPAAHRHLADRAYADKLKAALDAATGGKWLLAFEIGEAGAASLAAQERRRRDEAQAAGEAAFRGEPFVRELLQRFDGTVRVETIEHRSDAGSAPPAATPPREPS